MVEENIRYAIDNFYIYVKDEDEKNKFETELKALCNKFTNKHFFNFRLPTKNNFERIADDLARVRNDISRSGIDHYKEMTFDDEDNIFQLECKLYKLSKKYGVK